MIDIVKEVNLFKEKAKKLLLRDGQVNPVVFGFLPTGQLLIVEMSFKSYEEKQAEFARLREFLKEKEVTACVMVSEVWYLSKNKEEKEGKTILPSQHPEREEAILIIGKIPGRSYSIAVPFTRDGGEIKFREEIVGDSDEDFLFEDNLLGGLFTRIH